MTTVWMEWVAGLETRIREDIMKSWQDGTPTVNHGFATEEILWATGIWAVILTLSPIILIYMM